MKKALKDTGANSHTDFDTSTERQLTDTMDGNQTSENVSRASYYQKPKLTIKGFGTSMNSSIDMTPIFSPKVHTFGVINTGNFTL